MERKRYIADSKEPKKMRAPVRKRLPMEADWKLKEDLGRWRFRSSRFKRMKNERRSSRFSEEIYNRDRVSLRLGLWGGTSLHTPFQR